MFCPRCGHRLPDDALFCESCGLQIQQAQVVPQQQQDPTQVPPAPGGRRRWPIVLAVVTALAVVGAIIGLTLSNRDEHGISLQDQGIQATPASSSQGQSGSTTQDGTATQKTVSADIDLDDAGDYRDINLFLSNFIEWPEFVMEESSYHEWGPSFDREDYDVDQLANWAMWHYAINNEGVMDNGGTVPGATQGVGTEIEGTGKDAYPRSVARAKMEEMVKRYMGFDVDFSQLHGKYESYGDRVYEGYYRGSANAVNVVALADEVETKGDGTIVVDFTTYQCGYSGYVVEDKSWYGYEPDELIAAMRKAYGGANTTIRHGTATVEVIGSGDDRRFELVRISTTA